MARARNIKPGFFKNEVLAEMPCEARLLFIGLWTLADREGRLEDRPKRIKGELFAFDSFDVDAMLNLLQGDGFLTRYEAGGVRYIQIENFVKHQDPHYKEKASEIPAPSGRENLILAAGVTRTQRARILERDGFTCQHCGSTEHLCIDHVLPVSRGGDSSDENLQTLCLSCNTKKGNKLDGEDRNSKFRRDRHDFESKLIQHRRVSPSDSLSSDSGSLIPDVLIPDSLIADTPPAAPPPFLPASPAPSPAETPAATPAPRRRKATDKTPLPEGFGISPRVREWAERAGFGQLEEHLDAFTRKATANGYAYASWDDAFMEAIREDWAKLRTTRWRGQAQGHKHSAAGAAIFGRPADQQEVIDV
jgi:hypothetical protein